MSTRTTASVSTHILDTGAGRPAAAVTVLLRVRSGAGEAWTLLGRSATDEDGRCTDLPAPPAGMTQVRLDFETEAYFHRTGAHTGTGTRDNHVQSEKRAEAQRDAPAPGDSGAFFPEVAVTFAVTPGEHYHVPLLLSPFGYSVYRGS